MSLDCTLSILVACTDVSFMKKTIPHLIRACDFDFKERMLIVDTAPLAAVYKKRPDIGTLEHLLSSCHDLKRAKIIDSIVGIDYSPECHKSIYARHFDGFHKAVKDYRGYPVLGSAFAIEQAKTDFFLHFDSDILLHQKKEHNWIRDGMDLIQKEKEVLCVLPLSGPPATDRKLKQRCNFEYSSQGFYQFRNFTSRIFLTKKQRFEKMLPMALKKFSVARQIWHWVKDQSKSPLCPWEEDVTGALQRSGYFRADLDSPDAWTLHILDRGEKLLKSIDNIINLVERGKYPPEQAGRYDLDVSAFEKFKKNDF